MQHDEFIAQVQMRARLSDRGTAEAATRATLETLAERISGPLAGNLAAQLPRDIGAPLRRAERHGNRARSWKTYAILSGTGSSAAAPTRAPSLSLSPVGEITSPLSARHEAGSTFH